jgi:hypothetical protein
MLAGVFFLQTNLKSSKQFSIAKTNNYLQNEELIVRSKTLENDTALKNDELVKVANEIEIICDTVKSIIIFNQLQQNTIPENFESTNQWIEESGLGDEFMPGREGEQIVVNLKKLITKYNTLCNSNRKIPNPIEKILNDKLMQQSNYSMLSALSQIELYVIINQKQ